MADHAYSFDTSPAVYPYTHGPVDADSGDETAPTVGNFSPAAGTPIEAATPVAFDVTDEIELRAVLVLARMVVVGVQLYEVAWDGTAFSERYSGSSRSAIAGGHRYTIRRTGGWPAAPTVRVLAVDTSGNEAA